MSTQIDLKYDIFPSYMDENSSELISPSIKTTFNIEIPESIWEKYKDDEEQLLEWAIDSVLIPSLVKSFNHRHSHKS